MEHVRTRLSAGVLGVLCTLALALALAPLAAPQQAWAVDFEITGGYTGASWPSSAQSQAATAWVISSNTQQMNAGGYSSQNGVSIPASVTSFYYAGTSGRCSIVRNSSYSSDGYSIIKVPENANITIKNLSFQNEAIRIPASATVKFENCEFCFGNTASNGFYGSTYYFSGIQNEGTAMFENCAFSNMNKPASEQIPVVNNVGNGKATITNCLIDAADSNENWYGMYLSSNTISDGVNANAATTAAFTFDWVGTEGNVGSDGRIELSDRGDYTTRALATGSSLPNGMSANWSSDSSAAKLGFTGAAATAGDYSFNVDLVKSDAYFNFRIPLNMTVAKGAAPVANKAQVPVSGSEFTYNGTKQGPVASEGCGYMLTLTQGDAQQTNAGSYTATATLVEGYTWDDESNPTGTREVTWTIKPADSTISVADGSTEPATAFPETSVDCSYVTTSGGTLSAKSTDESVAIVAMSTDGKLTISPLAAGKTTITVSATADSNHTAPADHSFELTVKSADEAIEAVLFSGQYNMTEELAYSGASGWTSSSTAIRIAAKGHSGAKYEYNSPYIWTGDGAVIPERVTLLQGWTDGGYSSSPTYAAATATIKGSSDGAKTVTFQCTNARVDHIVFDTKTPVVVEAGSIVKFENCEFKVAPKVNGSATFANCTLNGEEYDGTAAALADAAEPVVADSLVYTGNAQIGISFDSTVALADAVLPQGVEQATELISGKDVPVLKAANVGTYTVSFKPADGYKWADTVTGTEADGSKKYSFTIGKGTDVIAVDANASAKSTLYMGETYTLEVGHLSTGALTVASTRDDVLAVEYNAETSKFTLTPKASGSATVNFSSAADGNYNAAEQKSLEFTVAKKSSEITVERADGDQSYDPSAKIMPATAGATKVLKVATTSGGTVTCASDKEDVATAAWDKSTGILTITAKSAGEAKLTLMASADANHEAPAPVEITVKVTGSASDDQGGNEGGSDDGQGTSTADDSQSGNTGGDSGSNAGGTGGNSSGNAGSATSHATTPAVTPATSGATSGSGLVAAVPATQQQVSQPAQQALAVGTQLEAGAGSAKATYLVTDAANRTVTYVKVAKGVKNASVPASVIIDGQTYKVTAIANNAFKGKTVKSVKVGSNVAKINTKTFAKAKKLKTVTLGKGVKSIGKKAFAKAKSVKTIVIKSTKLTKKSVKNSLKGSKVKTVKVPKKKFNAYKKIFTKKNCGKSVTVKKA